MSEACVNRRKPRTCLECRNPFWHPSFHGTHVRAVLKNFPSKRNRRFCCDECYETALKRYLAGQPDILSKGKRDWKLRNRDMRCRDCGNLERPFRKRFCPECARTHSVEKYRRARRKRSARRAKALNCVDCGLLLKPLGNHVGSPIKRCEKCRMAHSKSESSRHNREHVDRITPYYVSVLMKWSTKDVPPEIVEVKQQQIRLLRAIKGRGTRK